MDVHSGFCGVERRVQVSIVAQPSEGGSKVGLISIPESPIVPAS
jgi:hypothetical protein